jgi:hypothetical protein
MKCIHVLLFSCFYSKIHTLTFFLVDYSF